MCYNAVELYFQRWIMCNIAGYIGKRQAAPILCAMMKRQEGFGGGYYTGITTHDGAAMHTVKVVGDMNNLLTETDALSFAGTTGFLHSRSNSGGGVEWGQPFVSYDNNVSYIANGTFGYFLRDEYKKLRCDTAQWLADRGVTFRSRCAGAVGNYPQLADGTAVHGSDIVCQQIAYNIASGMSPDAAMSRAVSDNPAEIVGLVIEKHHPDSIFVTRVNYPMMIGVTDDGDTYLATTAMAFPDDVSFRFVEPLPHTATCEVYAGGYRVSQHPVTVAGVAPITPDDWHRCYGTALNHILNNLSSVQDVVDDCERLMSGTLKQGAHLVYELLRAYRDMGSFEIVKKRVDGAFPGYTTENFLVCYDSTLCGGL